MCVIQYIGHIINKEEIILFEKIKIMTYTKIPVIMLYWFLKYQNQE